MAGPVVGYSKLQRIVEITNAIQPPPDIVVITGDMIDGPYEQLKDATIPLERFNRPTYYITGVSVCQRWLVTSQMVIVLSKPCVYVSGNHEIYNDHLSEWMALLRSRGLRVLNNEAVSLRATHSANGSDAGPPLCLIGVDDKTTTELEYDGYSMNFSLALARCAPDAKQVVYLVHQPSAAYKSLMLLGAERVRVVLVGARKPMIILIVITLSAAILRK